MQQTSVYGLILAGGKSVRMGLDKGAICWHGKEQKYYTAGLLEQVCEKVFISCRADQQTDIKQGYSVIADSVSGAGPLCGILSAVNAYPGVAWLVAACDLPLLDAATLSYLMANRDSYAIATTFRSPFDGLPEPLITIWEPAAYPVLQAFFSNGFHCPRKALIRNEERVKMLVPPDGDALINANTPADAEKVKQIIAGKLQ